MGAREAKKRSAGEAQAWAGIEAGESSPAPLAPIDREDLEGEDAINELLGEEARPAKRFRFWSLFRPLRWLLLVVPILGLAVPTYFWYLHRSKHVTSTNAAVRGHLAEVGSRFSGLVSAVEVDVGDQVQAGQVLVRLEDRHLNAEVREARAEIAVLEKTIEVEQVAIELGKTEIEQQQAEATARLAAAAALTEAAGIRVEDARRNHEQRASLFEQHGAVSIENVRLAESQLRTAEAGLEEAKANAAVTEQSVAHKYHASPRTP